MRHFPPVLRLPAAALALLPNKIKKIPEFLIIKSLIYRRICVIIKNRKIKLKGDIK